MLVLVVRVVWAGQVVPEVQMRLVERAERVEVAVQVHREAQVEREARVVPQVLAELAAPVVPAAPVVEPNRCVPLIRAAV